MDESRIDVPPESLVRSADRPRAKTQKVLVVGNICAGKSTLARVLAATLDCPYFGIDECRSAVGDGSAAGEAAAWSLFLAHAEDSGPAVLDCSGSGPFVDLLIHGLRRSQAAVILLWVDTPLAVCLQRARGRVFETPYPDFGVPMEEVLRSLDARLQRELPGRFPWPVFRLQGDVSAQELLAAALPAVGYKPSSPASEEATGVAAPDRVLEWLADWGASHPSLVEAVLIFGSAARGSHDLHSDLDVALLIQGDSEPARVLRSAEQDLGALVRGCATAERGCTLWLGSRLLRLDLLCVTRPSELDWLAAVRDVPAPRLRTILNHTTGKRAEELRRILETAESSGSIGQAQRAQRAKEELDKFTLALDAAVRAAQAGDRYAAYFQHNLALHRLARVAELLYGDGAFLYGPRRLLDGKVPPEVCRLFTVATSALSGLQLRGRLQPLVELAEHLTSAARSAFAIDCALSALWRELLTQRSDASTAREPARRPAHSASE